MKFLNPRFHAGYLASSVRVPTVQNNAFVKDDRFKLSSFLNIPGEFGQFLSRKLREERSEWMRFEGLRIRVFAEVIKTMSSAPHQ